MSDFRVRFNTFLGFAWISPHPTQPDKDSCCCTYRSCSLSSTSTHVVTANVCFAVEFYLPFEVRARSPCMVRLGGEIKRQPNDVRRAACEGTCKRFVEAERRADTFHRYPCFNKVLQPQMRDKNRISLVFRQPARLWPRARLQHLLIHLSVHLRTYFSSVYFLIELWLAALHWNQQQLKRKKTFNCTQCWWGFDGGRRMMLNKMKTLYVEESLKWDRPTVSSKNCDGMGRRFNSRTMFREIKDFSTRSLKIMKFIRSAFSIEISLRSHFWKLLKRKFGSKPFTHLKICSMIGQSFCENQKCFPEKNKIFFFKLLCWIQTWI